MAEPGSPKEAMHPEPQNAASLVLEPDVEVAPGPLIQPRNLWRSTLGGSTTRTSLFSLPCVARYTSWAGFRLLGFPK